MSAGLAAADSTGRPRDKPRIATTAIAAAAIPPIIHHFMIYAPGCDSANWSVGVLEYVSIGVLECWSVAHHSITPSLHYSITPLLLPSPASRPPPIPVSSARRANPSGEYSVAPPGGPPRRTRFPSKSPPAKP